VLFKYECEFEAEKEEDAREEVTNAYSQFVSPLQDRLINADTGEEVDE
jgi:hypothetical protein